MNFDHHNLLFFLTTPLMNSNSTIPVKKIATEKAGFLLNNSWHLKKDR